MEQTFHTLLEVSEKLHFGTAYDMLQFLSDLELFSVERDDCSEIVEWCKTSTQGFCTFIPSTLTGNLSRFYFENKDDAMRFKLTWL